MTVLNELDRLHLAGDAVDRAPRLCRVGAHFQQFLRDKLIEHKRYIREYGEGPCRKFGTGNGRIEKAS